MKFTVTTQVDEAANKLIEAVLRIDDYPLYIHGVRNVRLVPPKGEGETIAGRVQIGIKYFTGWIDFSATVDPADTITIRINKGPFKFASAVLTIQPTGESSTAVLNVDCLPIIPMYSSLLERHKTMAFDRLMALFAVRAGQLELEAEG